MVIVQFIVKIEHNKLKIVSDVLKSETATEDEIVIGSSLEYAQLSMLEHFCKKKAGQRLKFIDKYKAI